MAMRVRLNDIRYEVSKYFDSGFDDDTNLSSILLSDDISAIILTLERKFRVKPDRSAYERVSSIRDLFELLNK